MIINPSIRQSSRVIKESVLPHWKHCVYCNQKVSIQATMEHIVPKAAENKAFEILPNGINSVENLIIACKKCNNTRGDKPFSEWIIKHRPETLNNLSGFFKALKDIKIDGVDYAKGVKETILKVLKFEKSNLKSNGTEIEELIKKLDKEG